MVGFHAPFYWSTLTPTDSDGSKKPEKEEMLPLPDLEFRPEWEADFADSDFHPQWVLCISFAGSICFPMSFLYGYFKSDIDRVAGGSKSWIAITWCPHLICGAIMLFTYLLFLRKDQRRFCVRNYNYVCSGLTIIIYFNTLWFNLHREIRRAWFQLPSTPQVQWAIDFQSIPMRACNDTDPIRTIRDWPFVGTAVGCNNLIISGNVACIYALVNLLPFVLRMRAGAAAAVTICNALLLVGAVLAAGSHTWLLASLTAFQLIAGLSAACYCHAREARARRQFLVSRHIEAASENERRFLHTLVPDNVLGRLATHQGPEMLGATIPHCTIMFCSLEPQVRAPACTHLYAVLTYTVCSLTHHALLPRATGPRARGPGSRSPGPICTPYTDTDVQGRPRGFLRWGGGGAVDSKQTGEWRDGLAGDARPIRPEREACAPQDLHVMHDNAIIGHM
jgi:hypothetical protein